MHTRHIAISTLVLISAALSAGCATTKTEPIQPPSVESIVGSVDQSIAAGDQEKALSILDSASKTHPTSPLPWLKKARVYFDAENYPSAILAAEEALQRDPNSNEAGSIALVSSLRIAVKYVSDLRTQVELNGDARPDGERLAAKLRETLHASVLVPPEKKQSQSTTRSTSRASAPPSRPRRATPEPTPATSGASNPFGSLK
jgi:tetratricopeptide (TPR) repeat protein